jgi:hypothetical protein
MFRRLLVDVSAAGHDASCPYTFDAATFSGVQRIRD